MQYLRGESDLICIISTIYIIFSEVSIRPIKEHHKHHERRDNLRRKLCKGKHRREERRVVISHDDKAPQPIDSDRQSVVYELHERIHD